MKLNLNLRLLTLFIGLVCCSSMQTEIEAVSEHITELTNRQKICEKKTSELEQKMGEMEYIISGMAGIRKKRAGESAAFSTILTYVQKGIGLGQTIKFDKVLLNDGSGYSHISGVFTAPVTGVYLFSYFIGHGGGSDGQVWMHLMQNGNIINGAVTDALHHYQDLQGGNVAIVHAQVGDQFWIESFHQSNSQLYGDNGFTSFSGALLY